MVSSIQSTSSNWQKIKTISANINEQSPNKIAKPAADAFVSDSQTVQSSKEVPSEQRTSTGKTVFKWGAVISGVALLGFVLVKRHTLSDKFLKWIRKDKVEGAEQATNKVKQFVLGADPHKLAQELSDASKEHKTELDNLNIREKALTAKEKEKITEEEKSKISQEKNQIQESRKKLVEDKKALLDGYEKLANAFKKSNDEKGEEDALDNARTYMYELGNQKTDKYNEIANRQLELLDKLKLPTKKALVLDDVCQKTDLKHTDKTKYDSIQQDICKLLMPENKFDLNNLKQDRNLLELALRTTQEKSTDVVDGWVELANKFNDTRDASNAIEKKVDRVKAEDYALDHARHMAYEVKYTKDNKDYELTKRHYNLLKDNDKKDNAANIIAEYNKYQETLPAESRKPVDFIK